MRLWLLRVCALLAGAISVYLFTLSFTGEVAAGCSENSGCGGVLGSRWSQVLGLPVSLPAIVVYAAVLLVSFQMRRAWARWTLTLCAAAVLGAAAWFVALQLTVLGSVCAYCMTAHALGGAMAVLALTLSSPPKPVPEASRRSGWFTRHHNLTAISTGLVASAALVAAQLLHIPSDPPVQPVRAAFVKNLDPTQYPTLGAVDAAVENQVAIGYLYDVNCPACRLMHRHLRAARDRYGDRLVIAMMPVVFHPDCNIHVSKTYAGFETSCELQKLSIAIYLHESQPIHTDQPQMPHLFDAFDAFLFEGENPPSPEEARTRAVELIGELALSVELRNPEVDAMLARHAELFNAIGKSVPRLIVAERVYPPVADAASLFTLLESLTPLESPSESAKDEVRSAEQTPAGAP